MSEPNRPESPEASRSGGLTRRRFGARLAWAGLGWLGVAAGLPSPARPDQHASSTLDGVLLESSPYVYISPLRSDGRESSCHGELWYAWLAGAVVVTVASDRWKASAVARGLDRARIWVGDHGRWKTWYGGRNEAFRAAPHFDARAEKVTDEALLERLLAAYETKYPDEIAQWRDPMRRGNADGSRVLLRYVPIDATRAGHGAG